MLKYIIRRLLMMVPLLIGVSIISFVVIKFAPGDPLVYMSEDPRELYSMSPSEMELLKERLGLNKPLYVQYWNWAKEVLQGNLGRSLLSGRTVTSMIAEKLPATLTLNAIILVLSTAIALPVGVMQAVKQYSPGDYVATVLAFVGISIPSFWVALMLIYTFSVKLDWFPSGGRMSLYAGPGAWSIFVDKVIHLILPVVTMTLGSLAGKMRHQRTAMIEALKQDYVRTARAKGLTERVVIFKHTWRNALIPIVTMLGGSLSSLVGGAYLVETLFAWPGMGRMGTEAIFARDYPVVMGVGLVSALMVMLGNLLSDILYGVVDPRIRY